MWPNEDETCELLDGARQGDAAAVNRLLDKHRDSLRRMVQARVYGGMARRVDASDVVQDALVEANRRLAEYLRDPRMPFHAWLRALARDRLVDAFRRQLADKRDIGREESLAAGDNSCDRPAREIADSGLTPAAMALKQEFQTRFVAALDQLPDEARDVILMRHSEQLTNSQAAELLGLSEAAAGMRYLRALRQLKAILGDGPSILTG
ncbi:MAG: sigma-70 family RNA polymerase sigma factor [Pirellulales bacterium]